MPVGGVNTQVPEGNQIFARPEQTERRGFPGRNRAADPMIAIERGEYSPI